VTNGVQTPVQSEVHYNFLGFLFWVLVIVALIAFFIWALNRSDEY
jgi:hypothetical protein